MTIKSETTADLINDKLIKLYGKSAVDVNDLNTWKYYLNISGEYHTTDEVMYITSLDTLQQIAFNKSNLDVHVSTRKEYQYGSKYYFNLVNKYPNQQLLINGILYPVDINTAIEARDGTILAYPSTYIEAQEISLISRLQSFIYNYNVRWDVKSFVLSDEYYPIAQKGIFYLNLLTKLLNIRLSLSKTNEAHSFHVKNYLASHNGLDKYMPFMTLKQIMFLYRNLLYIEHNAGKSEVFETLIDKLLTDRNIPLNEYSIRQLIEFDSEYYPIVKVRRKALNNKVNSVEQRLFDTDLLYDKESKLSKDNQQYYETNRNVVDLKFKTLATNAEQTKDLESSMIDYSGSIPDPYVDVLFREWAYNALTDRYQSTITVINPNNLNPILLSVKDAFIYAYYIMLKSYGVNVVDMPLYISLKHRKISLPTISEMKSLVENDDENLAELILYNQPSNAIMLSVNSFNTYATKIYEEAYKHWFIEGSTFDLYKHKNANILIGSIYEDTLVELPPETSDMNQWLINKGLDAYDLTFDEANKLIYSIFEKATGYFIDKNKVLSNIQEAMINILTILKSYTTQTIREINDSGIRLVNWSDIRVGDLQYSSDSLMKLKENNSVLDVLFYYDYIEPLDNILSKQTIDFSSDIYSDINIDIKINTSTDIVDGFTVSLYNNINLLSADYSNYDPSVSNTTIFIGYENFINLTPDEQLTIKDIYR